MRDIVEDMSMIHLSRLDGSDFVLNCSLVETIEARPDTVITTIEGKHFVVQQSVDEVVTRIIVYYQLVYPGWLQTWYAKREGNASDG
jgi:flagellar protein FlbD